MPGEVKYPTQGNGTFLWIKKPLLKDLLYYEEVNNGMSTGGLSDTRSPLL